MNIKGTAFATQSSHSTFTQVLGRWCECGVQVADGVTKRWARHALLDWLGVTIAGASEPCARIVQDLFSAGSTGKASIVGSCDTTTEMIAALINGTASHALDYDDVNYTMRGHPSVAVIPALLAIAEVEGRSGMALLDAIIVGHQIAAYIGDLVGPVHYARGFHATGTVGSLAAAGACMALMGADAATSERAIALACTQAAGLKSVFGSMAKPLHAGKAAMNGVISAQLALAGFTVPADTLEREQGFLDTLGEGAAKCPPSNPERPFIEQTLFKFHAACYLTHATIEAARAAGRKLSGGLSDVRTVHVEVPHGHLRVCNIMDPRTGLEMKFSIRQMAIMAIEQVDLASLKVYSNASAIDPRMVKERTKVMVTGAHFSDGLSANVVIETMDGRLIRESASTAEPIADLDDQERRLREKFLTLVTPHLGKTKANGIVDKVMMFQESTGVRALMKCLQ